MKAFESILAIFVGLAVLTIIVKNSANVSQLVGTGGSVFSSTFSAVTGGGANTLGPLPSFSVN